jgi:two-component system, sensor histidine kinase and response regulator
MPGASMSKILVIEDEDAVRENIVELLSEEGYEAIGATDGDEGVRQIWKEMPDLIICDILMPNLDGYGVLAKISQDVRLTSIPFLFLTARIGRDDLRKGMGLGADDYITKPFTRSELLQAITTRLGRMQKLETFAQRKLIELQKQLTTKLPYELLTPLSVTLGYSELLHERINELSREEVRGLAQDIHYATKRLVRLVENYLLFADLEIILADPLKAREFHQVDGVDVVPFISETARSKARQVDREIDLAVNLQPGTVFVYEAHLAKICEEMVDNAFRYSKKGSPVEIQGEIFPMKRIYRLRVIDQGQGMTSEQIRSVDGFIQVDRNMVRNSGLGLGLALVRSLVELYRGKLTIFSQPGKGAQVDVTLPILAVEPRSS